MKLTKTEHLVLTLAARPMSRREIAAKLMIEKRTVDFHLKNCYEKLGVKGLLPALLKGAYLIPGPTVTK